MSEKVKVKVKQTFYSNSLAEKPIPGQEIEVEKSMVPSLVRWGKIYNPDLPMDDLEDEKDYIDLSKEAEEALNKEAEEAAARAAKETEAEEALNKEEEINDLDDEDEEEELETPTTNKKATNKRVVKNI